MPPPLLIDLKQIDLDRVCLTKDEIYQRLPHRFEFRVLDGVCMVDPHGQRIVAYADIKPDDWWVRGHVPSRPLLPGMLMLEMAAQACAVLAAILGTDTFIGFGGVENCKFRETVVPPARLYILGVGVEHRARRIISDVQGVVSHRLIFEARVTGLPLP